MCGISGLLNCGDRPTIERMTSIQSHRGPDDSGIWEQHFPDGGYIGFGSRRLAILDLSPSGHMPMCNEDRTVWITYNGEIYNYLDLREELRQKGHHFFSETDTEVVLRLYEQDGPDCVKKLNGMFAFAICDLRGGRRTLFLARDHFGIKPLYYVHQGQRFAFASEIKALLQVPGIEPELDAQSLHQYLTFLWVPEPNTMFKGIFKLPPGHTAIFRESNLELHQYWDLTFPPKEHNYGSRTEAELSEELRGRFQQVVKRQMVSDVPIGAFLSAGLDSSSIVAAMAHAGTGRTIRTYTITFPSKYRIGETALDDPAVPARFAKSLGLENRQIMVEPDVADMLPRIAWHMDEPVADPAIITAYLVCKEARKDSTVLLSGVGGDELFAGYRKYIAHYWANAYGRIPSPLRNLASRSVSSLPGMRGTHVKGILRFAKKMVRSASLPPIERFVMNCTYLDSNQKEQLYTNDFGRRINLDNPADGRHREAFAQVKDSDFLNQMLYVDSKIFMPSLNLAYNDRMSMANSVEVRVPFLDRELAEFAAWDIAPEFKLKGFYHPVTKYIFRKAMAPLLPKEVLRQPKAGFAAPVDYWLAHDLREMVDDLLSESRIMQRGIFEPKVVQKFVDEQRKGIQDWSMQIWQFLTLEIWMQTFLDIGKQQFADKHGAHPQAALA